MGLDYGGFYHGSTPSESLLVPNDIPKINQEFITQVTFPHIFDAFVGELSQKELQAIKNTTAPLPVNTSSWLNQHNELKRSDCTTVMMCRNDEEFQKCAPNAPIVTEGIRRFLVSKIRGRIGFASAFGNVDAIRSLYLDPDHPPSFFQNRSQTWLGLPIGLEHFRVISFMLDSSFLKSIRHPGTMEWSMIISREGLIPEGLIPGAYPIAMNHATVAPTYLNSGISKTMVAALYSLGYNIRGLPERPPVQGIVMKPFVKTSFSWTLPILGLCGVCAAYLVYVFCTPR
jgi:hypothetical protein